MTANEPTIIVITGPTGVGKSDLALEIAAETGGEIVAADSRQVYRYLDIGTAKPTHEERGRVPHHLVDYVEPDEAYSVIRYRDDAEVALAGIAKRGGHALVVGGTGHYIQALIEGIAPPRVPPNLQMRAELEQIGAEGGPAALHSRLAALDAEAAKAIPASNVRRVIRALEVTATTGRRFSEIGRLRTQPRPALKLALTLPRETLFERVDRRVEKMLDGGWVDEVRALLARGYRHDLPSLSSTGYREIIAHLRGDLEYDSMAQKIKWSTHAYIRRQYVWLRRRSGFEWIEATPSGYARARDLVSAYLRRA